MNFNLVKIALSIKYPVMRPVITIISLTAFLAMVSACSDGGVSSSDHSHPAKGEETAHQTHEETHSKTEKVETQHSEKDHGVETRFAESHAHGDASLAIVLDKSKVTVEFDTPLYNLLGFEHVAETAAQKAAVTKAETVLSKGAPLFVFNSAAKCSILDETKSVDLDLNSSEEADGHHEDDHDDEHHDDDHDEGEDDETHKDLIVQYEFKCESPNALKNVTVNLFEHFENLTEVDLVYLGPNTQKQAELSATKRRMELTR